MPQAVKAQQTYLSVSTAEAAADNISGITAANPPVVTATGHGITDGTVVTISGVGGMVEVNDRAFVVDSAATNSFELKGEDASDYTAYTSGGQAVAHTMAEVGNVTSLDGFDGEATETDTTHLRSRAKEFFVGLQDFGNVTLQLQVVSDAGQAKLRSLKRFQEVGVFSITLSDGSRAAFRGYVKSFSFSGINPDGVVTGSVTIRVTGEPAWFA